MENRQKEALSQFFTTQDPLGDIAAIENADDEKRFVFQSYFDLENQPYQDLRREPSMIIGRKGSGKTDALLSYRYGAQRHTARYQPVVFFEASAAAGVISTVLNQITDIVSDNYPPPTVESVADFWANLFWISIICSSARDESTSTIPEAKIIKRFTYSLFNTDNIPDDPHHIIISSVINLRKSYSTSDFRQAAIGFFSAHSQLSFAGITIEDAKVAAQAWIRKTGRRAIVLFDSIESMDISDTHNKLVISGLLKAVGSFQSLNKTAQFRCCVPAETYFTLLDLSSNVLKDFRSNHILHWHASELLRICAKRYSAFLNIRAKDSINEYVKPFNGFAKRSDVLRFWEKILPDTVHNTKGDSRENTIPYINRHTQLLPRHFLLIFNRIISTSIQLNKTTQPCKIEEDVVKKCVADTESLIVDQVLESYRRTWPDATDSLKAVLPELNTNILTYSDFHKAYNKSGAGRHKFRNIESFEDYLRMMSELGAIGRLTDESDDYATAVFEYSEPHRLIFTDRDTLCIHPIFTEKFRVIVQDKIPDNYLPVYPTGTDPNGADYRERW